MGIVKITIDDPMESLPFTKDEIQKGMLTIRSGHMKIDEISPRLSLQEKITLHQTLNEMSRFLWRYLNSIKCSASINKNTGYIFNAPEESMKHVIGVGRQNCEYLETLYNCQIITPPKQQDAPIIVTGDNTYNIQNCILNIMNTLAFYNTEDSKLTP